MGLRSPVWSTALFVGADPLAEGGSFARKPDVLLDTHGLKLTRRALHTVADPFVFAHQGRCYLFVEEQRRRQPGRIVVHEVDDALELHRKGELNLPPTHTSYPFVFAHGDDVWLLPETSEVSAEGEVVLYRFTDFPCRVEKVATLLRGRFVDSSIVTIGSTHYLFTSRDSEAQLFVTGDLAGPYLPHPASPFSRDPGNARSGGALLPPRGDRDFFVRPAQDCRATYGGALHLMKVTALDPVLYSEDLWRENVIPTSQRWAATGSHHLSQCEWEGKVVTAVDGRRDDYLLNRITGLVLR